MTKNATVLTVQLKSVPLERFNALIFSRVALLWCVGYVVLLIIADLRNSETSDQIGLWILYWASGAVVTFCAYFLQFRLFLSLLKRKIRLVFITYVAHAVSAGAAAAVLTYFNKQFAINSEVLSQSFIANFIFYFLTFALLEVGIVTLQSNDESDPTHVSVPQTELGKNRLIHTGLQSIRISDLVFIKSDDHYCHVVYQNGETHARARFKDLMDQLHSSDGVIVYRGYWIAFSAIQSLDVTPKKPSLRLFDGTVIPIARSRASEIKRLMSQA